MMKKVYFFNKEQEKLVGILHKPGKKTDKGIVICHGFTGSKDRNFIPELARKLSKKYNVLRFDFSGNGESEGKFEDQSYSKYVEELKNAINFMKKENKKIIVIGHSMGSNIVVLEEIKHKNIDRLILLAPSLYIIHSRIRENYSIRFLIALLKGSVDFIDSWGEKRRLKKRFFFERVFMNPVYRLKDIKKPVFIILAEKDKVISLIKSKDLCIKYDIIYRIIKESGHNFAKEKYLNQVAKEITKWLK